MLKIGEFSKLSQLTVKALRFYEREGMLTPAHVDAWTGYRWYDTAQLDEAARIKSLRQLGLSVAEIKLVLEGANIRPLLARKAQELEQQRDSIGVRLSIINHLLKEDDMTYQVIEKDIPAAIVYYSEARLGSYADAMKWIPQCGAAARALNPGLKCVEPAYEYCEYLDGEYRESDILIRHSQAVQEFGVEDDQIKFREVPAVRVLSVLHKGAYEQLGEAYAYIMKYAEENGYKVAGLARESYIDGIWNKDSVDEWLTEIQLPVE